MQEKFRSSDGTSVAFGSPRTGISEKMEMAVSVRRERANPGHEILTLAAKEESNTGYQERVASVATKIFMARVIEAQLLLTNAVNEWNLDSSTWLNSVQRARNALNDLIRFGKF